jgi:ATP-dependent exoDNAse (exonuclease V) beta subunit
VARVGAELTCRPAHTHRQHARVGRNAQGITADATHAVLSENTTRSLLYVAMTRSRDVNTAYLYERATEQEYGLQHEGPLVLRRGTSHDAAQLIATIIATRDDIPVTAHDIATLTPEAALPEQVRRLIQRREAAIRRRLKTYRRWRADPAVSPAPWIEPTAATPAGAEIRPSATGSRCRKAA